MLIWLIGMPPIYAIAMADLGDRDGPIRVIAMLRSTRSRWAETRTFGWSGEDFARAMGVSKYTVSRWENEQEDMGATSERLLRLMALREKPISEYPNEKLAEVAQGPRRPIKLELEVKRSGWTEAA